MSQILSTTLHWRYEITSPEPCTVSRADGTLICSVEAGAPAEFTADGAAVVLSSDLARMLPTSGKTVQVSSPASPALSATGEPVQPLASSSLVIRHATWFDNTAQSNIAVQPAAWKNEVMTCYLKTAVPVALAGVSWLYGPPALVEGYTYVIALQQLDATTILANLAYSLPQ